VIDRAIQVHGGAGVSDDYPLAAMWGWHRAMRLLDGPDEVHLQALAIKQRGTLSRMSRTLTPPHRQPLHAADVAVWLDPARTGR
jgi:Acyl-CoA dehydrogenase, C-terminal domain